MSALHGWDIPLGLLGLGALFLGFAWLLLAEYRRLFLTDPLSVMSFEVLAKIISGGGPGYIAAVLLVAGALMFGVGVLAILGAAGAYATEFTHRLFPAT
jgi:hypothetical protein